MAKKHYKHGSGITGPLKVLATLLFITSVVAGIAFYGVSYYKSTYRNEQKLMTKELSELKMPADEEIRQEAAKSANLEYPVKPPTKTLAQITQEAQETARKLTDEKYNQKNMSEKLSDAMKLYVEAKPGQHVEFLSKNRSGPVKGTYKGKEGLFVLIDNEKYSMRDIFDEYKYLFDEDTATFKTQEKIKEIKSSYKLESDKFQVL